MELSNKSVNLLKKYSIDFDESLFCEDQYEESSGKSNKNIIVEAKRLILNEQLDKIVNVALCEVYTKTASNERKTCKQRFNWDDLENTPAPNSYYQKKSINKVADNTTTILNKIDEIRRKHEKLISEKKLLRKYFNLWQGNIDSKKKAASTSHFDAFFETLALEKSAKKEKPESKPKNEIEARAIPEDVVKPERFKNRFKAQKNIIVMQKSKLLEQQKIIEELKYGKVREELYQSIEETKIEMQQMLSQVSKTTKCKLGLPIEVPPEVIEVKTNQAPRIVLQMEKRAQERAVKRATIRERKRLLDEERKRMAEEIVENKKKQDEEEKQKQLEAIKERRRKELEMEKIRQANKERFLKNYAKAESYHRRKLKRKGFKGLKELMVITEENELKSELFYETKLKVMFLKIWRAFVEDANQQSISKATAFYKTNLLRKSFNGFAQNYKLARQNYQVAVDFYDLKLQSRVLKEFHYAVCKEEVRRHKLYIKAMRHYDSRILVQYFYQWRSLPAVLLLEKAKEEKKQKWREKVLQIVPDYKPPVEYFD